MIKDTRITIDELKKYVQSYEQIILNSTIETVAKESPLIIKYKGVRRAKLVSVVAEKPIVDEIDAIHEAALELIEKDNSISENVELFTISVISDSQRTAFSTIFMKSGLSLTITDRIQMQGIEAFKDLFTEEKDTMDFDSSLFEYLSMGNDTMDIKNSLFYALIMMMIHLNQPINQDVLERLVHEKYGNNVGDVPMALKALRKQKKIANPGKGGTLSLTEEEKIRLEQSLKEEKSLEDDFNNQYERIIEKYGVKNGEKVLNMLREAYQAQYQWHFQTDDDEKKREEAGREHFETIRNFVESQIGDKTPEFITELKHICEASDYLSRYSLSHSFLQLYRSSSYENYINNKESCIILDTPVLTNYLCFKSRIDDDFESDWSNPEYQSVKTLARLQENSRGTIRFYATYDYLQETVGELKKALQFSWFDQIDLAIPFETGNTFYNFYLFVKKERQSKGQNVKNLSFQKFVSELGFDEVNPDSALFSKKTLSFLKFFIEKTGNFTIDPVKERFDVFEKVREEYLYELEFIGRKKTLVAVNSDVRQALFLANEIKAEDNNGLNFFLATWDKSLRKLREIVNEEYSLMSSYSVMNPTNLSIKLAYKNFSLSGRSVSEDVFAYAESGYNFVAKVQSLYDNVLTPYFANANNHNSTLVVTMLKMEKDCQDRERKEDVNIKENTVLADILLPVVYALPDNNLSAQNLREFLADESNNDFVINLVQEAFNEYAKGHVMDISERFCGRMKEKLSKDEEEIKL